MQKGLTERKVRHWYLCWKSSPSNELAARQPLKGTKEKTALRSRAPVVDCERKKAPGQGRHHKLPLVRQALYEWWTSMRYAIDWKQLVANRRSRGKKNLARFPRAILRLNVYQLLEEHAYACLLNGVSVQKVDPNSWWFKRWEESYGLCMRKANRKYAVPRKVFKERLEIFWVVLFRIRQLILLVFGYDPLIENFDQSPFHHNETGSQNKPTLGVPGSTVPVVEGNNVVKSRWTTNLMTSSRFTAVSRTVVAMSRCPRLNACSKLCQMDR